ncbi:MAG: hypothetical protein M3348_07610 [Acidobacteriota bacterium]|nr:hypothetical protein [Acidobacteriota bacterium]
MTLMAGFDLVAEISNETVRKLLEKNLQIGGAPVNPPFELSLPISGGGASGTAHLIVSDLQVDLNGDDTVTLTLSFKQTSVMVSSPLALTVCPLGGDITINAALKLVPAGGSAQQVSVDLAHASVAINWSSASNQEIANDLAGTPISAATFKSFAAQALTAYVQSIAAPTIPLAFNVVPGANGSLTPSLQFEKLEVHCIGNADRAKQALGIFGILLVANHSKGNKGQKTGTAITAAHDGVCISIAPGAFHSLVFCPAIAKALNANVNSLPGSCGPAGGFDTQGVTINSITDGFADGHIDINGSVSKSGFCYDATGTFHGAITMSISGTTLTPSVKMDQPDVDVSIPWYCYLAAGIVLGPLGIAIAAVVDLVADKVASSLAGDALKGALGNGIPGIGVGGLSGASFSGVSITTEGLTLQGTVQMFLSPSSNTPGLDLDGSVITTSKQELGSGIFHTQVWCLPPKDYPYTEYAQEQKGIYTLSGQMVTQPLTPHFTISSDGTTVALTGSSGTVTLPDVMTHYPMPLATGGTALQQSVHIGYTITGTTVKLTNTPSEGDYSVQLSATATDCAGATVKDNAQHNLTASAHVQFEGDHVEIGGGYADDVQYCAQLLRDLTRKISERYKIYQKVPIWQQINYPAPDDMIEYIRDLVALGAREVDDILLTSKIAHGNSFYRAIFSPAATQPHLLREKAGADLERQQALSDAAQELTGITSRLLEASRAVAGVQVARGIAGRESGGERTLAEEPAAQVRKGGKKKTAGKRASAKTKGKRGR